MAPQKFTSSLFLDYPPILAHYVESERNLWVEGNPRRARLSVLGRPGRFVDLEASAVERRNLAQILGTERARAVLFRMGFESGRRDARRHLELHSDNQRLAIQAGLVYGQVQGRFAAQTRAFEMDMEAGTLLREIVLESSSEAAIHRIALIESEGPACWRTTGYLSGHLSQILGKRVLAIESGCACTGSEACSVTFKFDSEWGEEAEWQRASLAMGNLDEEIERKDQLLATAQNAARAAHARLAKLQQQVAPEKTIRRVLPEPSEAGELTRRITQLASVDTPALLSGEVGVGKETMARAIHEGGNRKSGPFIALDGSALAGEGAYGELAGSTVGPRAQRGALVRAAGGTLYIAEITRLAMDAQAGLARALSEGGITPAGASTETKIEVRLVASTTEDIESAHAEGRLHDDLFFALRPGLTEIEPLRERPNDIARLAQTFLNQFVEQQEREALSMSQEFKQALLKCAWPGNVSQLRGTMEHAVLMAVGDTLKPGDLPDEILVNRAKHPGQELSAEVVQAALNRTRGNRTQAAELLGVGRTTLWRAMKRHAVA